MSRFDETFDEAVEAERRATREAEIKQHAKDLAAAGKSKKSKEPKVLTEADSEADLKGEPRPDNPSDAKDVDSDSPAED
jgi:hypothetical protein